MPLAVATLTQMLDQLFAKPPATATVCAQGWANAVGAYAAGIVPPSTSIATATTALASSLSTAFEAADAVPGMESAFTSFGAAVGAGMLGFVSVPPAAPVGFASLFVGAKPSTHAAAAERIADAIHAWLTTGTSALATPPGSPPVVWS